MAKILVVYCTMTGNTRTAAEAVAEGVKAGGGEVLLKESSKATAEDLMKCDASAFGSYDAFSYMGGGLKEFFDRTFYPTQNAVAGKPYCAFVTHGGGGKAIDSIESVAKTFKLEKLTDPVLVKGRPNEKDIDSLREAGAKLAKTALV